jgi:hypothetical protein
LLLQLRYNGMSNRTLPEVVVSARRTANHRATHTIAIMHVHALGGADLLKLRWQAEHLVACKAGIS